MIKIKTGSDFSGIGAFDQALQRIGIRQDKLFACDKDKYARQTYIENYGEPVYFPHDVYDRKIPNVSLDIYMTSPPCQSFSIAGNRKGESDDRGILFYNSHEFIQKNKPRYFIFENVKGLLSDDDGKTFQRWLDYLGGKSVNGGPVIFPLEDSTPYHIYWKVLNAKDYGVPQNRERIFIVGIRDDSDNDFRFPKPVHLSKKLRDILEPHVDDKYILSQKALDYLERSKQRNRYRVNIVGREEPTATAITTNYRKGVHNQGETFIREDLEVGTWRTHEDGRGFRKMKDTLCPTIPARAREDGSGQPVIKYSCDNQKIRRLTPRECFRLMDFPETFKWTVSDTQAYKQAGNSIVVSVLAEIIKKLNFQ